MGAGSQTHPRDVQGGGHNRQDASELAMGGVEGLWNPRVIPVVPPKAART